ncbi:MAG: hypothetical protein HZB71_04050 [Betaproteobacteria bacterium]|nr:hypothetical protein [Betaproteobacteria bacterium]
MAADITLLPDAGPLITLAYAEALDLLLKPGWQVEIVDMVLHEVTRNETPTSRAIGEWVAARQLPVRATQLFRQYQRAQAEAATPPGKANLGEFAIQEAMSQFALLDPPRAGVFLFEDHKIARAGFLLPENARKVSTRAFLLFLERRGWLESAAEVELCAVRNGRRFSQLRFPPG